MRPPATCGKMCYYGPSNYRTYSSSIGASFSVAEVAEPTHKGKDPEMGDAPAAIGPLPAAAARDHPPVGPEAPTAENLHGVCEGRDVLSLATASLPGHEAKNGGNSQSKPTARKASPLLGSGALAGEIARTPAALTNNATLAV